MGAMITYGSYLKGDVNITKSAVQIASVDTLIAFMAGLVIFPIVFSNGLEPSAGPGLIFKTLPVLFAKMPGGHIVSIAFFALVLFAAITSAISLLEVAVSFVVDEYKFSRIKAILIMGTVIWALGILSAVSSWNVGGIPFLDIFDKISSCYMLPLGGLGTALVFAWAISNEQKYAEIGSKPIHKILLFAAKYVAPVLLLVIFIKEIAPANLPECSPSSETPCIDTKTDLIWSGKSPEKMHWADAVSYCEDLTESGYSDWRLPNIEELRTLIQNHPGTQTGGTCKISEKEGKLAMRDRTDDCYGIDGSNFSKLDDTGFLWSSSARSDGTGDAWAVNFHNGIVYYYGKNDDNDVRCVR